MSEVDAIGWATVTHMDPSLTSLQLEVKCVRLLFYCSSLAFMFPALVFTYAGSTIALVEGKKGRTGTVGDSHEKKNEPLRT